HARHLPCFLRVRFFRHVRSSFQERPVTPPPAAPAEVLGVERCERTYCGSMPVSILTTDAERVTRNGSPGSKRAATPATAAGTSSARRAASSSPAAERRGRWVERAVYRDAFAWLTRKLS